MIIEFSVANFRSIKELQTLSLSAASIVSKYKELDKQNVIISGEETLLKTKAIYGANASGKSNLIKAFLAFIALVNRSVKDEKILGGVIEPFKLSTKTEKEPSFFQLQFINEGVTYRYGFEVTEKGVVSEWLFGKPGEREVYFFTREDGKIEVNENQFREGNALRNLLGEGNDIFRTNSLFLTAVSALNGEISKKLVSYISSITVITGLSDQRMHAVAGDSLGDNEFRKKIVELIKIADVGIQDIYRHEISLENLPQNAPQELLNDLKKGQKHAVILTAHKKFNEKNEEVAPEVFTLSFGESEGSKKMFEISPFILQALRENRPLLMDEFDARFHPLLTSKIVQLFNSDINKGTQFIFATHDTNLLSAKLMRRDQISFVEKNKFGASQFYTLVDFKGVRNDASFEKDYIKGKYGAVPFVGDFNTVFAD
jgi:uncharacterized protein